MDGKVRLTAAIIAGLASIVTSSNESRAAFFDSDGGITLWISYENLDTKGESPPPMESRRLSYEFDTIAPPENGATCTANEDARATHGAEPIAHPCQSKIEAGAKCQAKEKLEADLRTLAKYIYTLTHERHFLKTVYVSEATHGRGWETADIQWNVGNGGYTNTIVSRAELNGWTHAESSLRLHGAWRACAPDEALHELGHYLYRLYDRYPGAYPGCPLETAQAPIMVLIHETDPKYLEPTLMSGMFPHRFSDASNAKIQVTYPLGLATANTTVLTTADEANSPYRPNECKVPFSQDEWSWLQGDDAPHVDLIGAHPTLGSYPDPVTDLPTDKQLEIRYITAEDPFPGTVLLLDNSNSMNAPSADPASRYVQEFAMFFYHSSDPAEDELVAKEGEYVGTYLYNNEVSALFDYQEFDPDNELLEVEFPFAAGSTNVTQALERAIQALDDAHGETTGANWGTIMLLSDGEFPPDDDLWAAVLKANQKGIKIRTVHYGVGSSTLMQEIAAYSSTKTAMVSAPGNPAELKLDLCREVTTLRGNTAIHSYKGKISDAATDGLCSGSSQSGTCIGSDFVVPPGTRDLLFYVFLKNGNAAALKVELEEDASGTTFAALPDRALPKKGRFNGLRAPVTAPGTWRYRVTGALDEADDVEIVAYAANPELDAEAWIEQVPGTEAVVLKAQLAHRYPLTDVDVEAFIYREGEREPSSIVLRERDVDRGGKEGVESDGVYSARLASTSPGVIWGERIRIDVRFETQFRHRWRPTKPGENVAYAPGVTHADIERDYRRLNPDTPSNPRKNFTAYATVVTALGEAGPKKPTLKTYRLPRRLRRSLPRDSKFLGVTIENAHPLRARTRVSLGADVEGQIVTLRRRQRCHSERTVLGVQYSIDEDAVPGPRDLKLQFGGHMLEKKNAIEVEAP